jgi:hypothetical protein
MRCTLLCLVRRHCLTKLGNLEERSGEGKPITHVQQGSPLYFCYLYITLLLSSAHLKFYKYYISIHHSVSYSGVTVIPTILSSAAYRIAHNNIAWFDLLWPMTQMNVAVK